MVNELESLQSIQSTLTGLSEAVTTLEESIGNLESSVDSITTTLESLDGISEAVGTLQESVDTLQESVDDIDEAVGNLESTTETLESSVESITTSLDNLAEPIQTITENGGMTRYRQTNEDNYASSTTIFFYDLTNSVFEWTINLYDYIIMGYEIHALYTTNAEDLEGDPYTDTTTDYITMRNSDTYVYIMPRSTVYKGEGHYHFIIRLTNSRVSDYPDLVDMFVIGRFSNRSRCYILNETQYNRLQSGSSHNPYKLTYPLVSYDSANTDGFITNTSEPEPEGEPEGESE